MPILKCKMCGGDLNLEEGSTVIECEYCGTKQTVPTIDDEKKIALFARANRLRFACEFDKASGIYESIVTDFPEEAEAYWGLVLCKYGIEYVDDPATGKKIPTCHRSSFESVMDDDNFEQVLENADPIARSVYREEAKQIEELRRDIIEVSNKEEPYDIFICYKETAENGERTIDSVIAQDVYDELTDRGYRVFFSRITLEDRLGQEYEPYIFAALNSARIMLAFGTDYEYYNAVWVKNEWSRFLQLISRGEKKTLIPCYKNIDAYDMPKEFAKLQAQDMGKIGAMQDLLRGIEKLLPRKENQQSAQTQSGKETLIAQPAQSATVDSLLKRAFMYLEDGDWRNAADYCNRVLDISPENAEAYVGLLMTELQVRKEGELARQTRSFKQNRHFLKAVRFAGEKRRKILEGYNTSVENYLAKQQEAQKQRQLEEEKRRLEEKKQRELDQVLAQMTELWKKGENIKIFQSHAAYWANPDNQRENCPVDSREPKTIGDRYLYLAEHFQTPVTDTKSQPMLNAAEWWKFTFDCYRGALKFGADRGKCAQSKQKFYETLLQKISSTTQLEVLEQEFPEDWRVYWKYFELCRGKPTGIPTYHKEVNSFLAQSFLFKQSNDETENERHLVQSLEISLREYSEFPQKQEKALQAYVEKAFAYAGDLSPTLQKEWKDYLQTLEKQCAKEAEQLTERLNQVQKKISDENRQRRDLDDKYKHNAIVKGTFCAAIALFLLMLAGYTIYYAWQIFNKPELLLPYSTFGYTIAALMVCLVEMTVFPIIQHKLVKTDNKPEYPYKKPAGNLIKCSRPLTALAALAAGILFVSGASGFNANIGNINISTPEEISYIKKHPGASFTVTQDIDLSDTEWETVSNFSGSLDGQGHCLKGIVSTDSCLFAYNTGTIQDISFTDIGMSAGQFSLAGENRGTIEDIRIQSIRLNECEFFGFARENKGTLQNCTLTDIAGTSVNFAGIAQENNEKGIIEHCTVSGLEISVSRSFFGIATDNRGMIANTVLSDCTVTEGVEMAGICRNNSGMVRSCRVEGLTAKDVLLSLGGGLIASSSGSVKDCSVVGLELAGEINGCLGGLIGQSSSGSVENCFVSGLGLSGEIDGVMGGLIGQANGNVTRCSVEGTVSLTGRSKKAAQAAPWLICGGLVGEQLGGDVKSSSSAVQITVDYYNPTYRGIFAGGLVGGIAGGCSISNSFFDGNIDIAVTEEDKIDNDKFSTSSETYNHTNYFYIGGLFGNYHIGKDAVSVENAYSSGAISVRIMKEVQNSSAWISLGGFTGSDEQRLSIRDSYANLQITSSVPPENTSLMNSPIRNSVGGFTPDSGIGGATIISAQNCFFNGKLEYANLGVGGYHNCGMWGNVDRDIVTNCYYSTNCGYGDKGIPENSFRSSSFLRDALGWSDEIWNLEDGALPTLKSTGPMTKDEPAEERK